MCLGNLALNLAELFSDDTLADQVEQNLINEPSKSQRSVTCHSLIYTLCDQSILLQSIQKSEEVRKTPELNLMP